MSGFIATDRKRPYIKKLCLKKILLVKYRRRKQKNSEEIRVSNTEGNYETFFLVWECTKNYLNQIGE
jgi:hypothetical protein